MRVVWTRRSIQELAAIGDYIAERNPTAAARIIREINRRTIELLSANPFIGREGHIVGTRELVLPALSYIIAYRVHSEQVEILFVQHAAREWPDDF